MPRPGRRFHDDDDDRDDPPRRDRRGPDTVLALAVLAGLVLLAAAVIGGLTVVGRREAARQEAEKELAVAQADAARAAADRPAARPPRPADPDDLPPPKPAPPPAEPPAIAPPSPFDRPGDAGRWVVLFRSREPALWNTATDRPDGFAVPLRSAPAGVRFLRLRRMDTGDALVLPMTRDRLARADPPEAAVRWNGEGRDEHGGYHLGVAEGPVAKWMEGKGTIAVLMNGFDACPGSGFGHAHHVEDGGQRYAWLGQEIPPTAFEVAVTAGELTADEGRLLRR